MYLLKRYTGMFRIVNIYVYKEMSFLVIGIWICVDLRMLNCKI